MSSTTASNYLRGALTGATLLRRLQEMADGVAKHGSDPGFTNFFATQNLQAKHETVALAIVEANAAKTQERALALTVADESAGVAALWVRAVAAIEAFYGLDNPVLHEFGLVPRKGPYSPQRNAHIKGNHTRRQKQVAGGSPAPTGAGAGATTGGGNG
jgi:hypothetical protein